MIELAWLIPVFPVIGVLINGLFGRHVGEKAGPIASVMAGLSFLVVLGIASEMIFGAGGSHTVSLWTWVEAGSLSVSMSFLIDPLSTIMLLVVAGVGFLVHVYAVGYMHGDPGYPRFFAYLNLFMLSMFLLVLGDNYLVMFVGWEGVGLCSYLLIGFWYEKQSASDAGKKAFIVNRIGDAGFLLGMFLIWTVTGSLTYSEVFKAAPEMSAAAATAVGLLLFVGAAGKSAQIPLYVWLPDAMEGPTPVSALIHAATMVTAGVYMVARTSPIYVMGPDALSVIAIVGALTGLFAASIGLVQNDIKRVLAYSTVSQLGFMFMALGVGAFTAAIFHLMTHAFFKGLLFLGSGSVIHALHHAPEEQQQDMRYMGGLKDKMPVTYWTFLIGAIAIAGVPPLAGFWSKDEILANAFLHGTLHGLGHGLRCGLHDGLLHVPAHLHDVPRRDARRSSRPRAHSRISRHDDGSARHPGGPERDWRRNSRFPARGRLDTPLLGALAGEDAGRRPRYGPGGAPDERRDRWRRPQWARGGVPDHPGHRHRIGRHRPRVAYVREGHRSAEAFIQTHAGHILSAPGQILYRRDLPGLHRRADLQAHARLVDLRCEGGGRRGER